MSGDSDMSFLDGSLREPRTPGGKRQGRDKAAVAVCVRVRPLEVQGGERRRGGEGSNPQQVSWRYDQCSIAPVHNSFEGEGDRKSFTFDNVFPPVTTTDQIYKQVLSDIVLSTVEGYNGCIFAYGQTSSGKTHTMTGTRSAPGVFTLASQEVFSHVQRLPDREFFFRLSYIEIYNEVVIDLLDPTKTGLQIRSSEAGVNSVVKIVGVTEKVVTSEKEVLATVAMGEAHRSVGSTDMNEKSSRSHTILRLTIESKKKFVEDGLSPEYRVSSLNLVDLAGSESASKSGGDGQRRAEGSYINKSLLTLATVIQRLITASGHIPYRDSKLTRILEPALGGNSSTAIICTITPAQNHMAETMNTLKFAARAKRMKNKPILNDINVSNSVSADDLPLLKKYRDEIESLRREKEQLEVLYIQQQEGLEHEKADLQEMKTILHQKIERYESMIVDLNSMSKEQSKRPAFTFKFQRRKTGGDALDEEEGEAGGASLEDPSKVFCKLKERVNDLQDRLTRKIELPVGEQEGAAGREVERKERQVAEFQTAVEEGKEGADEGKHLQLLTQVVGALKQQIRANETVMTDLVADMKNDLAMLSGVKEGCANVEKWARKKGLKEKGLNTILKDLHSKVSGQSRDMKVLTQENQELIVALQAKSNDLQLLEEQMYDFVGEIQHKNQMIEQEREHVEWLEQDAKEKQSLMEQLERRNLRLEEEAEALRDQLAKEGGKSSRAARTDERYAQVREANKNLQGDLERLRQENNTQRLQMQRMQSQLRNTLSAQSGDEHSSELQARLQVQEEQMELLVELIKSGDSGIEKANVEKVVAAVSRAGNAASARSPGALDRSDDGELRRELEATKAREERTRKKNQELERKVAELMQRIHTLIERRSADASDDEVGKIQAASEARMEEYMEQPDEVREEFVFELISRYEEERVLLERVLLQQVSETL